MGPLQWPLTFVLLRDSKVVFFSVEELLQQLLPFVLLSWIFAPVMHNHWDLERYQACEDLSLLCSMKKTSLEMRI